MNCEVSRREGSHLPALAEPDVNLSALSGEPPKLDQPRLLLVQSQAKLRESLAQISPEPLGVGTMLEAHHEVSRRRESHPPALAEPGVNVSAHRAPIVQPSGRTPSRQ